MQIENAFLLSIVLITVCSWWQAAGVFLSAAIISLVSYIARLILRNMKADYRKPCGECAEMERKNRWFERRIYEVKTRSDTIERKAKGDVQLYRDAYDVLNRLYESRKSSFEDSDRRVREVLDVTGVAINEIRVQQKKISQLKQKLAGQERSVRPQTLAARRR